MFCDDEPWLAVGAQNYLKTCDHVVNNMVVITLGQYGAKRLGLDHRQT